MHPLCGVSLRRGMNVTLNLSLLPNLRLRIGGMREIEPLDTDV